MTWLSGCNGRVHQWRPYGVVRSLREALPLNPQDRLELTAKFTTVIRATVKGNLVVAHCGDTTRRHERRRQGASR